MITAAAGIAVVSLSLGYALGHASGLRRRGERCVSN